jgi:hypothetical protein
MRQCIESKLRTDCEYKQVRGLRFRTFHVLSPMGSEIGKITACTKLVYRGDSSMSFETQFAFYNNGTTDIKYNRGIGKCQSYKKLKYNPMYFVVTKGTRVSDAIRKIIIDEAYRERGAAKMPIQWMVDNHVGTSNLV